MYKGKDQLSTSKSGVLKGGRAVGRPAGASVLCLFPIAWPEAMVCIFRTTAGSGQAGDLSSGFITARRMTHRADGALRSGCASARSRPLRPARSSPRPPHPGAPNLSSEPVCTALPGDTARPLEIRLFLLARCLVSAFLERLREALS